MTEQDLIELGFEKVLEHVRPGDTFVYGDIYYYKLEFKNTGPGLRNFVTVDNDLIDGPDDWFVMFDSSTEYHMYDKDEVTIIVDFLHRNEKSTSIRSHKLKKLLKET